MSDWMTFFPFATGEMLSIDGPGWYNGSGTVVKNEGNALKLTIAMPATSILGFHHIPELKATFSIDASKEGPGNAGKAILNDVIIEDMNIDISSLERAGRRIVDFSKRVRGKHLDLTIQKINGNRVDLTIQGYDFTVTRMVS